MIPSAFNYPQGKKSPPFVISLTQAIAMSTGLAWSFLPFPASALLLFLLSRFLYLPTCSTLAFAFKFL
jgi:hypothetical protein